MVVATFTNNSKSLSVNVVGSGTGTVTSVPTGISCSLESCLSRYVTNNSVVLKATPDASSVFSGWGGACSGTGTCQVTMDVAKSITASFALGQAITNFSPPTGKTYGDADITLTATGGASGNPVTFSVVSGPGTVSGTNNATLTITGAGTIVVKASQAGNASYSAAPDLTTNITVAPKTVTITANNASRAYGAANPTAPGFKATGLVGTDNISDVSYSYAATATATAAVGTTHSITPSAAIFSVGSSGNYSITYTAGTFQENGRSHHRDTVCISGTKD